MNLIGIQVSHAQWGVGQIIAHDEITLTVEFLEKAIRFLYPSAIGTHIQATDPAVHAAILQEIEDAKASVIAQQKAAEEAKQAAIQKQIDAAAAKKSSSKVTSASKKVAAKQARISGKPMTFFVFQNTTFDRELQGGYIWAPTTNKAGYTFHYWERLLDVRPGDVILHGYNAHVQAVSIAQSAYYDCVQPQELRTEDSWDMDGRRVDCDYILLDNPIKTADYVGDILRLCNTKYSPFNKYGTGNQGYLFELNREMAKIFLEAAATANPYLKSNRTITELLAE